MPGGRPEIAGPREQRIGPGITGDHDDAQINTVSSRGFSTNLTVVLADGAQLANANFNGNSRTYGRPDFSEIISNSTISERDLDETQLGDPSVIRGTIDVRNSGQARVMGAEFSIRHSLRPLGQWGRFFTGFVNATKLQLSGSRQADFAGFIPRNMNWGVTFTKKPVTLIAKWNYRGEQKGAAFPALGTDAYNYTAARTTLDLSGDFGLV